jgi:hypothetical protein
MYCRNCYAKLDPAEVIHRCPICNRAFDPATSRSYLSRPFPGIGSIISYIVATTVISLLAAFVIAMFQLAGASGH